MSLHNYSEDACQTGSSVWRPLDCSVTSRASSSMKPLSACITLAQALNDMLTGIEPRALAGGYFALTAYTIWGLAPIYFRAVGGAPFEIIAHRIVWSVVLLLAVLAVTRQMGSLNVGSRQLVILFGTAILLSINWLDFVTAVTQGQVIATSLGYFINPLVSVFLGLIFLKETLRQSLSSRWSSPFQASAFKSSI